MKKFSLLLFVLLSACATNEILYTDAKGVPVYKAQCDQAYHMDISDCIKLMGQQCPFGFNIVMANESAKGAYSGIQTLGTSNTNSQASVNAFATGNSIFANGYGNSQTNINLNSFGGTSLSYSRFIIYTCKNPE